MVDSSSRSNDMKRRGLVSVYVYVWRREEEEKDLFCRKDTIMSLVDTYVPVFMYVHVQVGGCE